MYRIGIDVGGTFTDLVAVDESGRAVLAKTESTPEDPSIGVMAGLTSLAEALKLDRPGLFAKTERIVHGTTVATNALLEHKGAKVGLLTTDGHRDVLEMREGLKDDRYNLRMPAPEPLVPRTRRLGVRERMRADGRVETPLDHASLNRAIAQLKRDKVEAVAVCYLHAYRDDQHERATAEALKKRMPDAYVSLSADVFPQIKEFERVSTTVVNAYVGPALARYLFRLAERLVEAGYRGPVLIIQSPGGVAGSRYAAKLIGAGNLIPFDMGGTSTDICLIVDGEATLAGDRKIGSHKVALNSLDIVSLGAGGGSIGRIDAGGILHVGPESAGAVPGPACYGRGGTAATVTDANVVLGFLDPANFLGGRSRLNAEAAEKAVAAVAKRLGTSTVAAAEGIQRVVNTNMAEGIRLVSVRRGADPRRFALLAFGGAAGLHVTEVARMLEINRVVVPRVAAVLSAWGMLATDLRHELVRTHVGDARKVGGPRLRALFAEMEARGRERLSREAPGHVDVHRAVDMRYGEQTFEITVPLPGVDPEAPDLMDQVIERFHRRHEELYTYSASGQDVVLVNARVAVVGALGSPPADRPVELRAGAGAAPRSRRVYLGRWAEVPVYDLDAARPGLEVKGPAICESPTTTVVLRQDDRAVVTPRGWLDIAVSG